MSLEYALEKFPTELRLRDGTRCILRPLGKRDDAKLLKFFLAVPEVERLFIKQRATDRNVLRQWCRHPDFEENLPLLMLHRDKVIGEATLHQRRGGWRRHIGLVTVLTHPDYHGRDVAKTLVEEIISIAQHLGLQRLEARFNGERKVAIRALELLGFQRLVCLPDYVLDMQSRPHDYVLMGIDLRTAEEYASPG
jgi:RimJ/RimL family protein N-acetyltransferase